MNTDRTISIVHSVETDPALNLALEEELYRLRSGNERVLMIYRNGPSVIVGRNQNPWLECDVAGCLDDGVPILRRITGGGTVYHDVGNVNYSFMVPRGEYSPERFMSVGVEAAAALGVRLRLCERQALWAGDRKVSGSAFTLTGASAMLHSCVLVSTDLRRLRLCLHVPGRDLTARAVRSVRSPVVCLSALSSRVLGPGEFEGALVGAVGKGWRVQGERRLAAADLSKASVDTRCRIYRSWAWTYGRTGAFSHRLHGDDGSILELQLKAGRVKSAVLKQESGACEDLGELADVPYDGACLQARLSRRTESTHGAVAAILRQIRCEVPAGPADAL